MLIEEKLQEWIDCGDISGELLDDLVTARNTLKRLRAQTKTQGGKRGRRTDG